MTLALCIAGVFMAICMIAVTIQDGYSVGKQAKDPNEEPTIHSFLSSFVSFWLGVCGLITLAISCIGIRCMLLKETQDLLKIFIEHKVTSIAIASSAFFIVIGIWSIALVFGKASAIRAERDELLERIIRHEPKRRSF